MARSQLLKDIVSGSKNLENVLLRLKVILSDLGNDPIINWVNGELQGYKESFELPTYRILRGNPVGTFIVNHRFKYTNVSVPLEPLIPQDFIEELTTLKILDSIAVVQTILNGANRENYARVVPTALCHQISNKNLQIAGMHVMIPSNQLDGIVSFVKSKLVDVILELEKQYEDLDSLDIRFQVEEDDSKREKVIYNIEQIIYDGSIEIGDKNEVSNSRLGHYFGGEPE